MPTIYLRFKDLKQRGVVSNRVTLARWIADGLFPPPIHLGPNSIAWRLDEIEARDAQLRAERDDAQLADEIEARDAQLVPARTPARKAEREPDAA